jgi:hypothetical protein
MWDLEPVFSPLDASGGLGTFACPFLFFAQAIPFIVGRATWRPENASDPYPYAAWRNVSGQWVPTPLVLHPQLWADVVGEYSLCTVDDSNVLCNVFADAAKDQLHVMLHDLYNRTVDVELNMIGASGMTVVMRLQRACTHAV